MEVYLNKQFQIMVTGDPMPLPFFLRHKRRVSLIIQDHVIRCVDVKSRDLESIRICGERYLPEGIIREGKILDKDTLEIILEECIQEWGIQKSEVLFLVPDPFVVVRKIQVPDEVLDAEIRGYFYMEIGASIHLPFENPVFDYEILGYNNNHKKEVLFFAAPELIVSEYVELLEGLKLKPMAADISSLALYRLYHHVGYSSEEEHLLSVHFDVQSVNIGIFNMYKLVFMRHVKMNVDLAGWNTVRNESGEEALQWSGDPQYLQGELDNVIGEIDRVMNFYRYSLNQGKEQITSVVVSGDHPDLKDIMERLAGRLNVPVELFQEELFATTKGDTISPRYYSCLGLALKEVP